MFTGIIEATGLIEKADVTPQNTRLVINAPRLGLHNVAIGDSVAVNGCCLTVVAKSPETFSVDVSNETLSLTTGLSQGLEVNLEKSLRFGDRLGGHLVSGHVDGVGLVTVMEDLGASWRLEIEAPKELARFVARKGSITVNGVSLTVNKVSDAPSGAATFEINIIPHTHQVTTIRLLRRGAKVNLEIDLLARYVERMMSKDETSK
ncbi:MAG: riboflavin synthase [Betaproteobacteria bacterium]|nr:riboflavin synthase [Betaproteobacteria bacterium]